VNIEAKKKTHLGNHELYISRLGASRRPQGSGMMKMMKGKTDVNVSSLLFLVFVLHALLLGCGGGGSDPGKDLVIRETGYLSCDLSSDQCTDGLACTRPDGEIECVAQPTDCQEQDCSCLQDIICDTGTFCTITDAGATLVCQTDQPAWEPCAGKACGETCTVCDPNRDDCDQLAVERACNSAGECSDDTAPVCEEYEPCAGKFCGAPCTICDPADRDCTETDEEKVCYSGGTCDVLADDICMNTSTVELLECSLVDLAADPFTTHSALIDRDILRVTLDYSGGCELHTFGSCFGSFQESATIGVLLNIGHDGNGDSCDGVVTQVLEIDLTPMREEHKRLYPAGPAEIDLQITGLTESVSYRY
jgi:hypothetical protein